MRLIFAKQFEARNDILREEVCHFWTAHSPFVLRVEGADVTQSGTRCPNCNFRQRSHVMTAIPRVNPRGFVARQFRVPDGCRVDPSRLVAGSLARARASSSEMSVVEVTALRLPFNWS